MSSVLSLLQMAANVDDPGTGVEGLEDLLFRLLRKLVKKGVKGDRRGVALLLVLLLLMRDDKVGV